MIGLTAVIWPLISAWFATVSDLRSMESDCHLVIGVESIYGITDIPYGTNQLSPIYGMSRQPYAHPQFYWPFPHYSCFKPFCLSVVHFLHTCSSLLLLICVYLSCLYFCWVFLLALCPLVTFQRLFLCPFLYLAYPVSCSSVFPSCSGYVYLPACSWPVWYCMILVHPGNFFWAEMINTLKEVGDQRLP